MKITKSIIIGIIIGVIVFVIIISGYISIKSSKTASPEIDCTNLKHNFDEYAKSRYLPIIENFESLCYGLNVGSDFSELTPKWAVGELLAVRGSRLTFEGILEDATISIGSEDTNKYEAGRNYKIDMNNICRGFFMMVDSRYPSPISTTFVRPEGINCK